MIEWLLFPVVIACLGVGAILPLAVITAVLDRDRDVSDDEEG